MGARIVFVTAMLLLGGTSVTLAEGFGEGKARVRLVASADRPWRLGVRFEIEPGWHIYWKNPGGAGMATEVQWRVPEGVAAGETQWPLPIGFVQSGEIPGYGYEETAVLAAELGGAPLADTAEVGAEVSWLACKDVCVLGSAELEARWSEVPADPIFSHWASEVPAAWNGAKAPFSVTTTGGLRAAKLTLWLEWNQTVRPVEWYPDPPEGLVVEDVTIRTRGGLSRIDASLRKMAGVTEVIETLPSVLVVAGENEERRGWSLAVDLTDNN
jgi:hypothetical protein